MGRAVRLGAVALGVAGVAATAAPKHDAPSRPSVVRTSAAAVFAKTVGLAPRARTEGCRLGANPDRRCSPGAYYQGLTKRVLCSAGFRTGDIRNVPDSVKHAVEVEYGLVPRRYGDTLEIDHIISLELGGSNDISNLYPEKADGHPGYHVKDKLENKLHALVCAGAITLRAARHGISENWQSLYQRVFGVAASD